MSPPEQKMVHGPASVDSSQGDAHASVSSVGRHADQKYGRNRDALVFGRPKIPGSAATPQRPGAFHGVPLGGTRPRKAIGELLPTIYRSLEPGRQQAALTTHKVAHEPSALGQTPKRLL